MAGVASDVSGAERPRLLVALGGLPHPTAGASAVVFHYYLEDLQRNGFAIHCLIFLEEISETTDDEIGAFAARFAQRGDFTVGIVRRKSFATRQGYGYQIDFGSESAKLAGAIAFRPNIVLAFDLIPAMAVRAVPATVRAVWLGDLRFQTELYHAWHAAQEDYRNLLYLPGNFLASYSWRRHYVETLRSYDLVLPCAASSVPVLKRLGIDAEFLPYPWPTAVSSSPWQPLASIPRFLFFGALGGLGSRSAFHMLTRRVYPKLVEQWGAGGFEIRVCGRGNLPTWVEGEFAVKPEFRWLGFVEDISREFAQCHASIFPIDVPIGNRTRIITAMAGQSLCVAHANTAAGNPDLVDGETCLLARDASEFASRMRDAVENQPGSAKIIAQALASYRRTYAPNAAAPRLREKLLAALNARPAMEREQISP